MTRDRPARRAARSRIGPAPVGAALVLGVLGVLGVVGAAATADPPTAGGSAPVAVDPAATSPEVPSSDPADVIGWECPADGVPGFFFDVPGPGQPTPERAVEHLEGRTLDLVRVEVDGGTARVAVLVGGHAARVYELSLQDDGWWPEGYRLCGSALDPASLVPTASLSPDPPILACCAPPSGHADGVADTRRTLR